jgi:uncharacterized repeat protein (TIGR01451 family)
MARRSLFTKVLCAIAACCLAGVASSQASNTLGLRTISNIATIEWGSGDGAARLSSNRVDVAVQDAPPASVETFRIGGSTSMASLSRTSCRARGLDIPFAGSSRAGSGGAFVEPTDRLAAGESLIILVNRPEANLNADAVDSLAVDLRTAEGDVERLTLVETGPNTGRFVGGVATAVSSLSRNDCLLWVTSGEPLAFELLDVRTNEPFAGARIDILGQGSGVRLSVQKTASTFEAQIGEPVQYQVSIQNQEVSRTSGELSITDLLPAQMRLRPGSVRINGVPVTGLAATENRLSVTAPALAAGQVAILTYILEVRSDAAQGQAVNTVAVTDGRGGTSNIADAIVQVRREDISDAITILGRVLEGGCEADPKKATGIAGVRIMLEDGSYAVTDEEGRYHFNGISPGLHVVQIDDQSLPADQAPVDCGQTTRSAGSLLSRFVHSGGGVATRVDFHAAKAAPRSVRTAEAPVRPQPASDASAAGADRDWLAGQQPGIAWLFPERYHNPRAPVIRVAIKHLPGQSVKLLSDGRPVDPTAFDGARKSPGGDVAVSLWRGVPLEARTTRLTAEVRDAGGKLVETLVQTVQYAASPMRAELLRERSLLIADGITRPVIAVRLLNRDDRPVRHGLVGDFEVPAPYRPAVEADAQHARQLAGLDRAKPFWRVEGDDGVAYIELEPTTTSGSLSLRFQFRDGEAVREQRVEAWLDPGARPWTIVGLAAGTVGFDRLDKRMERLAQSDGNVLSDGRLALYAKGRIKGKWLITLAYDSDKKERESRFGGTIDPNAYYTVYADGSERRYDAASVRRLYLKLERPQFYAVFGDYETGIDEPQLARYVRALNGLKAEYRSTHVAASAFAADTPTRHRREEIQGNGLSGPYALRARDILLNSERVTIEVRDRLRSDRIVERRLLSRHIDYDIDYLAGTLVFKEPILSRSSQLDPQFIVIDYEIDEIAGRSLNAGGRVALRSSDGKLQVAATAIRDKDGGEATLLAGADIRYKPSASTELRAEAAVSKSNDQSRSGTAKAWLVEAEHHGRRVDLLAYAREQEQGFGVGQVSDAESGTRKIGLDGRVRLFEALSIAGSVWQEDYAAGGARRIAAKSAIEYRGRTTSARVGLTLAEDRLADGRKASSEIVHVGATKRLLDNRLELDAQTEIPISGADESIDFPARHKFSARLAVSPGVQLVGSYEIANGEHVNARTARIGFDVAPWAGARIALSGNLQDIAEYGPRSFAAYGLSQSLVLDEHWALDFSVDGNKSLKDIDPARTLNPLHPVASGGFLGSGGLTEDFTAITAGATYRARRWSTTGRAEYRSGDTGNRYGLTAAMLREIGEGRALGASFNWFAADAEDGASTRTANLQLSWAHRPAASNWSFLEKLELRDEQVTGAVAGEAGPLGMRLDVTGDARSRRIVNALSTTYSVEAGRAAWLQGAEISLFWGSRYVADKFGEDDIAGWSNIFATDLRLDLSPTLDIGASASVRLGADGRTLGYSAGPSIGLTPFENGWLSIGWNILGFEDRDFEESRYTRSGPYATMRLKFDQMSLQALGLGRR